MTERQPNPDEIVDLQQRIQELANESPEARAVLEQRGLIEPLAAAKEAAPGFLERNAAPIKYGLGTVAVAGTAWSLYAAGKAAWDDGVTKGKPVQAGLDVIPVTPEAAAVAKGLGTALWEYGKTGSTISTAAKAGTTKVIEGAALGFSETLALAAVIDIGQWGLRENGVNVDIGYTGKTVNNMTNFENANASMFPGDALPMQKSALTIGTYTSLKQTGPYQWDATNTTPMMSEGAPMPPFIQEYKVDERVAAATFTQQFATMGAAYQNFVNLDAKGNVVRDKEGRPVFNEDLSDMAKEIYDFQSQGQPDKAVDSFRDNMLQRTINQAYTLAKQGHVKIPGTNVQIEPGDELPKDLLQKAATQIRTNVENSYVVAKYGYVVQGLQFLDQTHPNKAHLYSDPKNLNASIPAAYDFLDKWQKDPSKGNFDWGKSDNAVLMTAALDKVIQQKADMQRGLAEAQAAKRAAQAEQQAHLVAETPYTRFDATEMHRANKNIINVVTSPTTLLDESTQGFDNARLNDLQTSLVQSGHLASAHQTGTANAYMMRGIDAAFKTEMKPQDVTGDMRSEIIDRARQSYDSLIAHPADPKSFDVRVLNFQGSAYLLGLYSGKIDGLGGTATLAAQQQFAALPAGVVAATADPGAASTLTSQLNAVANPAVPVQVQAPDKAPLLTQIIGPAPSSLQAGPQ